MSDWVVRANGYFYRPDGKGYTSSFLEAGRYSKYRALQIEHGCEVARAYPASDFEEPVPEGRVMFTPPPVTADAVRAYREEHGASMWDGKRAIYQQGYRAAMAEFRKNASLEDKVNFILDWITEKEMS